jgi:hypothetical protein
MEHEVQVRPVDLAVAVSATALGAAVVGTRRAASAVDPLARALLRPRLLPEQLHAGRWLAATSRRGQARRDAVLAEVSRQLDVLVPELLTEVLRRVDLTDLLLRHVDLDRVVAAVDLDGAVRRVDVAAVVDRVDVVAVVDRVDLDAVAQRLDLDAVLSRLDLTAIVLERVDLDAVIQAVLARLDLVGLAEEVIEGVDLPEIIRESTGSMASDTVQGVRMQAIGADEAVGRAVDRFLLRRNGRSTGAATSTSPDRPG